MFKFLSPKQQKVVLAALVTILSAVIPGSPLAIGVVLDAVAAAYAVDERYGSEQAHLNTTEGTIDVTQQIPTLTVLWGN